MSDTAPQTDAAAGTPAPEVEKPLEPQPKVYSEDYVRQLRDEAAASRVAKRDAVEAAKAEIKAEYEAKLAERDTAFAEKEAAYNQQNLDLAKLYATLDAKVPSDRVRQFAALVQGDDDEAIAGSVKSNLELFGDFQTKSPAFDPTQGTGGSKPLPLNGDPILAALTAAISR